MDAKARVFKKIGLASMLALIFPLLAMHGTAEASSQVKHVLLISVDGLHQSDLKWYVYNHPDSELAKLVHGGAEFINAHTAVPSDSDPGATALMTGGDPRTTGVYYDVSYDHGTYEAGTTSCHGQPAGGDVVYDSPDDIDSTRLDAGQHIPGIEQNPALIMNMTGSPQNLLVPSTFPVDPATCQPIWPHSYLQVNTIFEVAKAAGLRTAWSDKHPVYESFNGPSGHGIDDFFAPEIDSHAIEPNGQPYPDGADWAHDDAATKQYDGYKVQAIINEIDGYDHGGQHKVGVPAIFGMNFQTVSVAQKLLKSPATLIGPDANGNYTLGPKLLGGYLPGTTTPGPLLKSALDYVDAQLHRMVHEIHQQGLTGSTAIIVTAKHGQSPQDPDLLRRIDDGPIITAINNAWDQKNNCTSNCAPLIIAGTDDDLWQSYLSVKTQAAADFVKSYLWAHSAPGVTYNGTTVSVPHSGLAQIYAGQAAADFFGVPASEPRHPDVFGRVQVGVVYTGGSKIAEHGGDNPGDRDIPILIHVPGMVRPGSNGQWVETTQVAPTILTLLGLDPLELQAVRIEHTPVLPGKTFYDDRPEWGVNPPSPAPKQSTLTVNAVDQNGRPLQGIWTVIRMAEATSATTSNGVIAKEGYTPLTFVGHAGTSYTVSVANYDGKVFKQWNDDKDHSTNNTRTVNLNATGNATITATYNTGESLRGFSPLEYHDTLSGANHRPVLTINAISLESGQTLHMWMVIDPQQSTNSSGTTYKVYATNGYQNLKFDHWADNGSTDRVRTLTIDKTTTITAYYRTG